MPSTLFTNAFHDGYAGTSASTSQTVGVDLDLGVKVVGHGDEADQGIDVVDRPSGSLRLSSRPRGTTLQVFESSELMLSSQLMQRLVVAPGQTRVRLADYDTAWAQTQELKDLGKHVVKERAQAVLQQNIADLTEAQELLYASDERSVLVVLQAMDAAGKDGTIKHVMSGVNPQGVQVYSFKTPSVEETHHDFLWRCAKVVPERGRIGIFNRSYYEDVLIVRVHPEILDAQLGGAARAASFWDERYADIRAFEHHLVRSGTVILKFFLHVSKQEQKARFLERLDNPAKHWKFSASDLAERRSWDKYIAAYEQALAATSTTWAPWYVVPADYKWAMHAVVADVITSAIRGLQLQYPTISAEQRKALEAARAQLREE
ncbi:MAG: Polyphosphate kinase 2 [Myxococcales bacterium]|nr:Polyphosphate kinase 2 [Myxococcales bacterium]